MSFVTKTDDLSGLCLTDITTLFILLGELQGKAKLGLFPLEDPPQPVAGFFISIALPKFVSDFNVLAQYFLYRHYAQQCLGERIDVRNESHLHTHQKIHVDSPVVA
jgi:hypothetical protein